jgi:hypothetical protein
LRPEDAKEWDAFVSGLKPGGELAARLKDFVFTRERQARADTGRPLTPSDSLAESPRALILTGLEGAAAEPAGDRPAPPAPGAQPGKTD